MHYLDAENELVLIVDSARMDAAPGEYAFFRPEQVVTRKQLAGVSTHEGDLLNVLELAAAMGGPLAPVTILGIEPAELGDGAELSPVIAERFDEYVTAAVEFMASGD